jgi:osmotically inducible protein OsmC
VQRTADVTWEGNLARGAGHISGRSGALDALPYTAATRIGAPEGKTSPEELVAAAHAGCYAMSLAGELTSAGTPPERLSVTATCTLDEVQGNHLIVAMDVEARARVPDIDEQAFMSLARKADAGCTISALVRASAQVSVRAELEER